MAAIGQISNGETGASVRAKLNLAIAAANAVGAISAYEHGVLADDATDDTAAWGNAFAAAVLSTGKRVVRAPDAVSRITSITVPENVTLEGVPCMTYLGDPATGSVLRNTSTSQTAAAVTLSRYAAIRDISVLGAGGASAVVPATGTITSQCAGIRQAVFLGIIENVNVRGFLVGIDMNFCGGHIRGCRIQGNHTGILNGVDVMISDSFVSFNLGDGIKGGSDVMLTNTKVEWNNGHGLYALNSSHWTVTNCVLDRNGKTGLRTESSFRISVVGNVFRRNGRLSSGVAEDDCHWFFGPSSDENTVTGNITAHAKDDDGTTGYDSPAAIMGVNNLGRTYIDGNILTGYAVSFFGFVGQPGWVLGNNIGQPFQFTSSSAQAVIKTENLYATNGNSAGTTFAGNPVPQWSMGVAYDFAIIARNQGTGAAASCSGQILITNEGGTAAATRVVTNVVGTSFALTGGSYNVTATCNADGSSITLTIANAVGSAANFQATILRRAG